MRATITFSADNAALSDHAYPEEELQRIMRDATTKLLRFWGGAADGWSTPLLDINGNTIGSVSVTTE